MQKSADKDNIISQAFEQYKKLVPNPLISSLLFGGLMYGGTRLLWKPIKSTAQSLFRPFLGKDVSNAQLESAIDTMDEDFSLKKWVPPAVGLAALLAGIGLHYKNGFKSLLTWDTTPTMNNLNASQRSEYYKPSRTPLYTDSKTMTKTEAFVDLTPNYISNTQLNSAFNLGQGLALFQTDPHFQDNTYLKNMGTAILTSAAQNQGTTTPTYGSVLDSAIQKFDTKLSFEGLAKPAVRAVIANATGNLFTGALGTMLNLDPITRRNLVDAGTWAGAISGIIG